MDDCDIAHKNALRRIVHPGEKCPENPLFIGEMPWEGNLICGGIVRKEDDEYRMWYQSYGRGTYINLYAQSADGLQWKRPALGQYPDFDGNVENNIFLSRLGLRWDHRAPVAVNQDHNPNVLHTPHFGADKQYTLISYDYMPGRGMRPTTAMSWPTPATASSGPMGRRIRLFPGTPMWACLPLIRWTASSGAL